MNFSEIEALLNKYFEGTTSLEEEQELKAYFNQETAHIDPEFQPYQDLFKFFNAEGKEVLGPEFESALLAKIQTKAQKEFRISPLFSKTLMRVAAVIFLAMASWWIAPFFYTNSTVQAQTIDWSRYEPETVEEAFEISKKAFRKVAKEIKSGAKTAANELDNLQSIGKFSDPTTDHHQTID